MIFRCTAMRKQDRFTACNYFVAAVPDGSRVDRIVRSEAEARHTEVVVGCGQCGTLYAIRPPERKEAA